MYNKKVEFVSIILYWFFVGGGGFFVRVHGRYLHK